jgi:hypothetical protein
MHPLGLVHDTCIIWGWYMIRAFTAPLQKQAWLARLASASLVTRHADHAEAPCRTRQTAPLLSFTLGALQPLTGTRQSASLLVPVESTHPSCAVAAALHWDGSVLAAHGAPGTSAPSAVGSLTQRQAGPGLRASPLAGLPLCPCTGLWQSPAFARLDLPDSQGCQSALSANHLHRGVRESRRPDRALFLVSISRPVCSGGVAGCAGARCRQWRPRIIIA